MKERTNFEFEIKEHIATLTTDKKAEYQKQLNLVKWENRDPAYDLRLWKVTEDGKMPLKGITLTAAEMEVLKTALNIKKARSESKS